MTNRSIAKLCLAGVLLSASGRAAASDGAVVTDRRLPAATAAQIAALEDYNLVSLNRIYFSTGMAAPIPREKTILDQILNTSSEHADSIIELRGYADGTTSPDADLALSLERANAIARHLMARGLARERIVIAGLGEVDATGPPRRREHQRVDVRVFAPPTAVTCVPHERVRTSLILDNWGGK